jgi:hypothetical protein
MLQQVFGVNTNYNICHGAILLCLVCYVTTKIVSRLECLGDSSSANFDEAHLRFPRRESSKWQQAKPWKGIVSNNYQYIIRSSTVRRMKSKLYLFNMFGMLGGYTVVVILNFIL